MKLETEDNIMSQGFIRTGSWISELLGRSMLLPPPLPALRHLSVSLAMQSLQEHGKVGELMT